MTLRSRLFVAFVAVVGVPLLVGLVLLASSLPRSAANQQERAVASAGSLAAQLLAAECAQARAAADAAGRAVLAVPAEDVEAQEAALRAALGDAAYADARSAGLRLTLAEATALAARVTA